MKQGYQVESHECVGSTNALSLERAREGCARRLWIVADEQTQGRARRGRAWNSPKGNLYASLLLVDEVEPIHAAKLGFVAGVSMAEAIYSFLDGSERQQNLVNLKWPNDILLKGAKASGILLELSKLQDGKSALTIGIGMNVKFVYADAPYPTASLRSVGLNVSQNKIFTALSQKWALNYQIFQNMNGQSLIRDKWLSFAAGLQERICIISQGVTTEGIFVGIDEDYNCLIKDTNQNMMRIAAGDVHFGSVATIKKHLYE